MEENDIIIYPNPTRDIINIASKKALELRVFNIVGELVIYWDIPSDESRIKTNQVDMSLLSTGIYNFAITSEERIVNKKVIKQWENY